MKRVLLLALSSVVTVGLARPAAAGPTYVALGDSITFGETDLQYVKSFGDRGYVGLVADHIAGQTGTRPEVVNLAIDGETTASFKSGAGRVPPVIGRTDAVLAAENKNYDPNALVSQDALFRATVASQKAAGNRIDTVSISLGFNDLGALASSPFDADKLAATLGTYRSNYTSILSEVRAELPDAHLLVLNYYNPFAVDPASPAAPIFDAGGKTLNGIIKDLAAQYGGKYVDAATPFVGHEAAYTYQDDMPHGSAVGDPYGGVLPIGNVHPTDLGYAVIAAQATATAVPLPPGLALFGPGAVLMLGAVWVQRRRMVA